MLNAREPIPDQIWDLIVIGGGISGAGIAREAAKQGLSTLLLEQGDFASGTSSRSSKLVHGGLRYLSSGQWRLTAHSVREREALMQAAPGLVDPQPFVFPIWKQQKPGLLITRIGLWLYDLIARKWRSKRLSWQEAGRLAPGMNTREMAGVLYFEDARTDDARLVLRVLQEACAAGASAYNYCRVSAYLEDENGRITGVRYDDVLDGGQGVARAKQVINASGAWAAELGGEQAPKLRPLRGSHLVFDARRFPLPAAVSFVHPQDRRPVFAFGWEGVSLLGTTDLDHPEDLNTEPNISEQEVEYLLAAAEHIWPAAQLRREDVISTYAGVRPVVDSGADNPSDESRESATWSQPGLFSVTGGKLTTFRMAAQEVLSEATNEQRWQLTAPVLDAVVNARLPEACGEAAWQRLQGRYGAVLPQLLAVAEDGDFQSIADSVYLRVELRWAALHESVQHLDDLLLRRTRLGLVLPQACRAQLSEIRDLCQPLLGWDDRRWANEEGAWYRRWEERYSLPKTLAS